MSAESIVASLTTLGPELGAMEVTAVVNPERQAAMIAAAKKMVHAEQALSEAGSESTALSTHASLSRTGEEISTVEDIVRSILRGYESRIAEMEERIVGLSTQLDEAVAAATSAADEAEAALERAATAESKLMELLDGGNIHIKAAAGYAERCKSHADNGRVALNTLNKAVAAIPVFDAKKYQPDLEPITLASAEAMRHTEELRTLIGQYEDRRAELGASLTLGFRPGSLDTGRAADDDAVTIYSDEDEEEAGHGSGGPNVEPTAGGDMNYDSDVSEWGGIGASQSVEKGKGKAASVRSDITEW